MVDVRLVRCEVADPREQVLEPHQRADALVQWVLVTNHDGR
jgi:hypothetical protein